MIDRECLKFISNIRDNLGYTLHGEYLPRFDANVGLGNGCVSSYFDEIDDAVIGVEPSPMTDYDWTEYDFMKCYISMLHEATHIYQRQVLTNKKDNSSRFVTLGYLAGASSKIYYEDNYFLMPDEIAAQYSALKNGYNILCNFVGEQKANDMVCNYVNNHINDEFIQDYNSGNYTSVEDIFDDYDKAFKASKSKSRTLDVDKYKELLNEDSCYQHMDCVSELVFANKSRFINEVKMFDSGIKQDFYLTNLYINMHSDEYDKRKDNMKSISDLNFMFKFPSLKKSLSSIRNVNLNDVTPDFSELLGDDVLSTSFNMFRNGNFDEDFDYKT